ncbi:MAG TPA: hypothetical protein VGF40_14690 [Thermoanaerobaculia bacterium]
MNPSPAIDGKRRTLCAATVYGAKRRGAVKPGESPIVPVMLYNAKLLTKDDHGMSIGITTLELPGVGSDELQKRLRDESSPSGRPTLSQAIVDCFLDLPG